jgi:hypothetical protein
MNRKLRNTIATLLTGSALTVASGAALAIDGSQTVTDLGTVRKNSPIVKIDSVANYAWDGNNNNFAKPGSLFGWAHNSKWYTVNVNCKTGATVQFTMQSQTQGLQPAFSIWKTNGSFVGGEHLNHSYNQVSFGGESKFLQVGQGGFNPIPPKNGTTAFIGYANSGPSFTNGDGNAIKAGTPGKSRVIFGKTAAFSQTLSKGQYLIAIGGSCATAKCGTPPAARGDFSFTVQEAPILPSPPTP